MDKTLRQILRNALLSTVKPDNRDLVEGLIEQTAKEIESLPPQQAVSDEEIEIQSEEKMMEFVTRIHGATYNGKSDFALGWRHCFDWMRDRTPPSGK